MGEETAAGPRCDLCGQSHMPGRCVRARKLDDLSNKAVVASEITGTRCATGVLWVLDQYDRELSAWEEASRAALKQLSEGGEE